MLTVYGIETCIHDISSAGIFTVATVLTVYGIETAALAKSLDFTNVATVLTVYGIET